MRSYFKNKTNPSNQMVSLESAVDTWIKQGNAANGLGAQIASFESFNDSELSSRISQQLTNNEQSLEALMTSANFSLESYIDGSSKSVNTSVNRNWLANNIKQAALQAGALLLEAASDPFAYRRGFKTSMEAFNNTFANRHFDHIEDFTSGDRADVCGIMNEKLAMEAFENQKLSASMNHSVAYGLVAAIQEPAIEMLFHTIVMDPSQVCFFYEIQLDRFHNGFRHQEIANGRRPVQNFLKQNLMAAVRRPSILRHDVLNVRPYFRETGPDAEKYKEVFMPVELREPVNTTVAGVTYKTQPLKVGVDLDLLELSEHPGLANGGTFDETDTLDSNLALDAIFLGLTETDSANSVVEVKLDGIERRNWIKSVQGHGYDMDLKFITQEILLDEKTVGLDQQPAAALKAIIDAGYRLRIRAEVYGTANTETGFVKVSHAEARIEKVYKITKDAKTGKVIQDDLDPLDPSLKATLSSIKPTIKYFYPYGNRTNRNLRTQGITVDTDVYTAKFAIGVRSPVRLQRPVGSDETYPTVDKLFAVIRTRQSADGWYEFFRYRDVLKATTSRDVKDLDGRIPDYVGYGKFLVRPHYDHITVDLRELIKSSETKDNLDNVRGGLVGILQEAAARAVVQSEWNVAATMLNNGKQVKPHFGIITDNYLPLLLTVESDLRLLGAGFDHTIVTSTNEEIDNKIFMTFVVSDNSEFDPLRFGHTFLYPEIVTTISPHVQNGAYKDTVMYTPRYQHVPNLPILIEVDVLGVQEFMNTYNVYRVKAVTETVAEEKAEKEATTGQ